MGSRKKVGTLPVKWSNEEIQTNEIKIVIPLLDMQSNMRHLGRISLFIKTIRKFPAILTEQPNDT
jgi:hypothetical protein